MKTVYQYCTSCKTETVHDIIEGKVKCKVCEKESKIK
jgi:hypothetical protein